MCRLRRGGLQTAALAVCWIAPSFAAGEPNLPVSDMLGGVPHARASARARCHWGERGHDRGQGLQWPPGGSPAGGPGRRLALQPSVGCKRLRLTHEVRLEEAETDLGRRCHASPQALALRALAHCRCLRVPRPASGIISGAPSSASSSRRAPRRCEKAPEESSTYQAR